MSYSKADLIKYRIDRSLETLSDAKLLIQEERWNSGANRLYYACFYMATAYLVFYEIKAITHTGVKTKFNQELIKTGRLDRKYGVIYNKLFALRQDADYEDFNLIDQKDIASILQGVEEIIGILKKLIEE